jgi:hypothetical protein
MGNGFLVSSFPRQSESKVVMDLRIMGIDPQGLFVMSDGS